MRKVFLWVVATIALAVYLNIGWAAGTYIYKNVNHTEPKSFTAKVLAGPHSILSKPDTPKNNKTSLLFNQVFLSFAWPLIIVFMPILAWTIYATYWVVYAVYWIAWLIFAGGLAKLAGVG